MKLRQLLFESNDLTVVNLKRMENSIHERIINTIKSRPSMKSKAKALQICPHLVRPFDILTSKKIEEENTLLAKKCEKINFKKSKPELNDYFLKRKKVKLDWFYKKKKFESLIIEDNNQKLYGRITTTKPFFNAKLNDKNYKIKHNFLMNNLTKFPRGIPSLVFPKLSKNHSSKSISKSISRSIVTNNNFNNDSNYLFGNCQTICANKKLILPSEYFVVKDKLKDKENTVKNKHCRLNSC